MRHEVTVRLAHGEEIVLHPSDALPLEEARRWLDQEFIRLECEPARASGKVLFADKLLAVAEAADSSGFADAAWADRYARAALGALGRTTVRVDLENNSVGH
jgi:hypothetical protein